MNDIWSVILGKVDQSTRVSCRLTCLLFNSLLPRFPSVAMFYNHQCIIDGNSQLMRDDQPLVQEYYSASIKTNDVNTIRRLLDNDILYKMSDIYRCILFDREEIFKLLAKEGLDIPDYFRFTGKEWMKKYDVCDEQQGPIVYEPTNLNTLISRSGCITFNNIKGFRHILHKTKRISKGDVNHIICNRRAEMYRICIEDVPNFPYTDEDIARLNNIELLKYARKEQVMRYVIYNRCSKNVCKHLAKELFGISECRQTVLLEKAREIGMHPTEDDIVRSINNLDYKMIEYHKKHYSLPDRKYLIRPGKYPLTLETWNLIKHLKIDARQVRSIDVNVILQPDFPRVNVAYMLESEADCWKMINGGRKFLTDEVRILFGKKFLVSDELIEKILWDSCELSDVNYPVMKWLYRRGINVYPHKRSQDEETKINNSLLAWLKS